MPKQPTASRRPEPRYASGEVRLTHNSLALLHGLLDRPGGAAPSIADWIASATPYVGRFRYWASISLLQKASRSVHADWVQRKRVGGSITVTLTPRGREIVERKVPARIIGEGPYTGLPRGSADHTIPGLRSYPPALRPSNLPSLDVPGFDLNFRPSSYSREFTEIARITFGDDAPAIVCFYARRVGRSFRLSAVSFPIA